MDKQINERMTSLDIFRGGIIILLVLESLEFFEILSDLFRDSSFLSAILNQFFHARWEGLTFWDVIQPGFMFIAGTAMTLSLAKRMEQGESYTKWFIHILKRSIILFVLGVGLHWVYNEEPVFELQNVLTQLAVTTLVTALVIRKKPLFQLLVSLGLILLTSAIYRIYNSATPFVPGRNAGTAFDIFLSGHADSDNWVALNFLPTSAHTIWGAITGWILIGKEKTKKKVITLSTGALSLIIVGMILHLTRVEPMIKRICTSSFVMVSGGIVILILLSLYLIVDERKVKETSLMRFFTLPGKNSIFVYLFSQIVIPLFLVDFVSIFTEGICDIFSISQFADFLTIAVVLLIVRWMLLWLSKNKISVHI